jgi:hypothetical protein
VHITHTRAYPLGQPCNSPLRGKSTSYVVVAPFVPFQTNVWQGAGLGGLTSGLELLTRQTNYCSLAIKLQRKYLFFPYPVNGLTWCASRRAGIIRCRNEHLKFGKSGSPRSRSKWARSPGQQAKRRQEQTLNCQGWAVDESTVLVAWSPGKQPPQDPNRSNPETFTPRSSTATWTCTGNRTCLWIACLERMLVF